jgi:hypothetical protein
MSKFSLKEFHDFYLASHIYPMFGSMREEDVREVIDVVEHFTQKLLKITIEAYNGELSFVQEELGQEKKKKHVLTADLTMADYSAFCHNELGENGKSNLDIVKRQWGSLEKFERLRKKNEIEPREATFLFGQLRWQHSFGGMPWATISGTAAQLQRYLPATEQTIGDIFVWTDDIIDLEHNTALYLEVYCDFELKPFLEAKSEMTADDLTHASPALKSMYKRYKSLV